MKKHLIKLTSGFIFLLLACEKEIDIDLNTSQPTIVIEGLVSDQLGPYTVKLTHTVNFDENNTFPPVSGASVIIYDDAGNREVLTETNPGIYHSMTIQGTPGRTYFLEVKTGDDTYEAVSTMPSPVNIDTLTVEDTGDFGPAGHGETITVHYTDPVGESNYYRFVLIVNGVVRDGVFIDNDDLHDGDIKDLELIDYSENTNLTTGDTATVVLQTIDENVYEYFRTLREISGSNGGGMGQSTSPANPISNISNGALGYFSVCAETSKTIVIP